MAVLTATPSGGVVSRQATVGGAPEQGEILVKFRPGTSGAEIARVHARSTAAVRYRSRHTGWQAIALPPGADPRQALKRYRGSPEVEAAEYVLPRRITKIPNDLRAGQWGFRNTGEIIQMCTDFSNGDDIPCGATPPQQYFTSRDDADIDAAQAWNLTTGSRKIVVAVLDTGVDHTRFDLSDRLVGGIDLTDPNGPSIADDDQGHGTLVASVIGAIGNNGKGITGLNWNVRIMPIKVCARVVGCPSSAVLAGIEHAVDNGADVINLSLACDEHLDPNGFPPGQACTAPPYREGKCVSDAERETLTAARDAGVVVVAAAGNCHGDNDDASAAYPCSYDVDGLICAGATDSLDAVSSFSNYGPDRVDIGAPGSLILAHRMSPPGGSAFVNGTSFASPMTAGVAALMLARVHLTPAAVRDRIVEGGERGVHPVFDLTSDFEGGRLNAYNTLRGVFLRRKNYSGEMVGDVNLIADLTGDGRGDLVRGFTGSGFRVSVNSAKKRRFLASSRWTATPPTGTVLAGDVNDDGKEELILGDGSGFRVLIKKASRRSFMAPQDWSAEPAGLLHAAGDVNGDDLVDLIRFDGDFDVLLSTGTSFQAPASWSADTAGDFIAAVDVDADGRADLANWFNGGGSTQIEVSLSTGSAFGSPSLWFDDDEMDLVGAGDFDADGFGDLLGVDPSSGCLNVILSDGSGFESPRAWTCPAAVTDVLLTGRVGKNRDARVDVVVHFDGGRWRLFESTN
jgi:subtilisin family serine protease